MKIGFIGLGKMGYQMSMKLIENGFKLVVYDIDPEKVKKLVRLGAEPAKDYRDMVLSLDRKRIIWTMLPSGEPSDGILKELSNLLENGDILIDGSNSNYKRTRKFYEEFRNRGIHLLDAGVSGGVYGYETGYCIMVGGDVGAFREAEEIFKALAIERGYRYIGTGGSGHFVKMVHNAIEYVMMEAIAEGVMMLKEGPFEDLNIVEILDLWNHGSIIRSFLLDITKKALEKEEKLEEVLPYVEDTGEGRWAVQSAVELRIPVPLMADALMMRFISQREDNLIFKVLALMRHEFGGHEVKRKE